jgi:hypothetical protein
MKFGDKPPSQRDQCLAIAERLRGKGGLSSRILTRVCIDEGVFPEEELDSFKFAGALRRVQAWLKTRDATGLPFWGQLKLPAPDGEHFWQKRPWLELRDYAFNCLLRDDVVNKNIFIRDRWRKEGSERWSEEQFDAEVAKLRAERPDSESGAAA